MSLVLQRRGRLSGLDCGRCEEQPRLRESLGCGEPPVLDDGDHWSPQWFERECARHKITPGPRRASQTWWPANLGHIHDQLNELWPFCPAYYARKFRGPELRAVGHLIELADAIEDGRAWMLRRQEPLTPRELTLVNLAIRLQRKCDREDFESDLEAIKNGGKP